MNPAHAGLIRYWITPRGASRILASPHEASRGFGASSPRDHEECGGVRDSSSHTIATYGDVSRHVATLNETSGQLRTAALSRMSNPFGLCSRCLRACALCVVRCWFAFVEFVSFCFPGVFAFPCGPSLACPLSLSLLAYFIFLYSWVFLSPGRDYPVGSPSALLGGAGGDFF